jgi:uncharacterized membrane protein YdbT with pleckstrin-like domain
MNFSQNLSKDEVIITQAKVHWACLLKHILLMLIWIGCFTIWVDIIRMFTTQLVLTNKRIYGKVGLINTKTLDTPLGKINNVSVESGLFGKIFGYGTINITNSSGAYSIKCVKSPDAFRNTLMSEIDKYDENRIKKQASEMANAMNPFIANSKIGE